MDVDFLNKLQKENDSKLEEIKEKKKPYEKDVSKKTRRNRK